MTPDSAITLILDQVGLSTSTTSYRNLARDFMNLVLTDVVPTTDWWWLNATTTFNTVADTRTYQPVSAQVAEWYSFMDETNNWPLEIVGPDQFDQVDVDRDDSGVPEYVLMNGLDATTGYPIVELWRKPDAAYTIRVRYQKDIAELTSGDDSTDMSVLGLPRIIQNVLIHGATALYMADQGNDDAARYEERRNASLQQALTQNRRMRGNVRYEPIRRRRSHFFVRTDSTLAVEP